MNPSTHSSRDEQEINFFDLIDFLCENWKVILGGALFGTALAAAYVFLRSPIYEAKLQVEMARVGVSNAATPQSSTPIEDPNLLIERLRVPSTYSQAVALACDTANTDRPLESMVKVVEARQLRSVGAVAEITVRAKSPTVARSCAIAVFEMIRVQQNGLMRLQLDVVREQVFGLTAKLEEVQAFLHKMEKTNIQSAVYLARRDEVLWLRDQIANLDRSLRLSTETKLVSPVYSPSQAVTRGRTATLAMGCFVGLVLGIMFVIVRKLYLQWKRRST